jgi:hypothetical protein
MPTMPSTMANVGVGSVLLMSTMLWWMPAQCSRFFGQPYTLPGTTPNMFLSESVTPAQWCILSFGIETSRSDFTTVSGR